MLVMSAIYRIVVDDCPPIPEKASNALQDFLRLCFRREPSERPTAIELFEHDWLDQVWESNKDIRAQDSVPFLRRISNDVRKLDSGTFSPTMEMSQELDSPSLATSRPAFYLRTPSSQHESAINDGLISPMTVAAKDPSWPAVEPGDNVHAPVSATSKRTSEDKLDELELARTHAFVKSTFSKPMQCKVCHERTKRHAVLCEECGFLCHASCADQAPMPCNLRAQLLLASKRLASAPAPPRADNVALPFAAWRPPMPSSPLGLKFPLFSRRRASSKGSESMQGFAAAPSPLGTSPANVVAQLPQSAPAGMEALEREEGQAHGSETSDEAIVTASNSSGGAGPRRHSEVTFGSLSASSSISHASIPPPAVAIAEKTVLSAVQPVKPAAANPSSSWKPPGLATLQRKSMETPRPKVGEQRHRRRISAISPAALLSRDTSDSSRSPRGQMTPKAGKADGDCVIA